jgi:hypothetical protein
MKLIFSTNAIQPFYYDNKIIIIIYKATTGLLILIISIPDCLFKKQICKNSSDGKYL